MKKSRQLALGILIGSLLWTCKIILLPMLRGEFDLTFIGEPYIIDRLPKEAFHLLILWILGIAAVNLCWRFKEQLKDGKF